MTLTDENRVTEWSISKIKHARTRGSSLELSFEQKYLKQFDTRTFEIRNSIETFQSS